MSFRSPGKVLRRLRILPLATRHLKNWPSFVFNYALGRTPAQAYRFRNGAEIETARALEHVPLIEIFLRRDYGEIADGSVILDLGANVGSFSVYAATSARDVRIFAYEPLPAFFALLERNLRRNNLEQAVRAFPFAVAAENSSRQLQVSGANLFFPKLLQANASVATSAVPVECITLEEILRTQNLAQVDLLKMDCEGAEYEILYQTPPEILACIRELRLEYHQLKGPRETVENLKRFLVAAGYDVTHEEAVSPTNGNLWARRAG